MIAIVDVDYRDVGAVAAGVFVHDWTVSEASFEIVESILHVEDYVPGEFYRRELPCLLEVLAKVPKPIDTIVIDGYVWLGPGRMGLGAHLSHAIGTQQKVIGIAKTRFQSASEVSIGVVRGGSKAPLWVSAAGFSLPDAADLVRSMHGEFRLPTLVKRVDRLCRDG